jgi:hypothetical protein
MGILTPEMKEAVPRIRLSFVATVSPDGKPNLSAKGSLCRFGTTIICCSPI